MVIELGQKFYKREGYDIYEYSVVKLTPTKVTVIIGNRIIEQERVHFLSYYSVSRVILLREIYIELHEQLQKVEEELIKQDLKSILNKYKGYNNESTT